MSFSTIQYQTNASDKFVATKQDAMVKGGNNGVQITSPEMQDFVKNQNNVSLERTPQNDSVTLKGVSNQQGQIQYNFTLDDIKATEKKYNFKKKFMSSTYKMTGKGVDLTIKDGFLGGRTVKGTVDGKDVNLKLNTTCILGGIDDKSKKNKDAKVTIYLNATCVFGGLDIK